MRVIALANQKGGVAKTTSTANIGAALVRLKRRVLLIDLDPQAHLTRGLGLSEPARERNLNLVLRERIGAKEALVQRDGLEVLPSVIELSGAEFDLSSAPGREYLLRDAMRELKGYDYVLLDCPPSLGLLTLNALVVAREIYVPVQAEYYALAGVAQLLETVKVVERRLNNGLRISGIIGTRVDLRKKLHAEVLDKVRVIFKDALFKTVIRDNVSIAEAPSHGKTIFEYKPKSKGAEDYLALAREIIRREAV